MTASGATTPTENTQSGEDLDITQESIDRLLAEEGASTDGITLDETFDILRNQRRRDVLLYLIDTEDGRATLSTLAEHVAAKENDVQEDQLTSTQRKRVYIGLYQCHLPKMDDVGVVEYDQDRGTVTLNRESKLFTYLPETEDEDSPSRVPLYLAAGLATVTTVGGLGPGPLGVVPVLAWLLVSSAGLLALGTYASDYWSELPVQFGGGQD